MDSPGVDREPGGVAAIGEVMACLDAEPGRLMDSPSLRKSIGGAEANVCIGLARLGHRTALLTRVGADPFGEEIIRTLRGENVDVSMISRSAQAPTGLMIKEHRSADRVNVYYYRDTSAVRELCSSDLPSWRPQHLHASGINVALGRGVAELTRSALAQARSAGSGTSFDPNFRGRLTSWEDAVPAWRAVLPHVTDLLCGEEEALQLSSAPDRERALQVLLTSGPQRVVIRLGPEGSIGMAQDHDLVRQPALPTRVTDVVGAGDAFTTGYLHEILHGRDLRAALHTGSWCAAHAVAASGDYHGLPTSTEYRQWVGNELEIDR